jgi:diamine N-acetyltransferase
LEKITIRQCTIGDETAISLLGQATFLESFAGMLDGNDILAHCANQHSISIYHGWLKQNTFSVWVAEIQPGNAPIGYLAIAPPNLPIADPRADDLEIKRIYLLSPFQGMGIGKGLMQEAFNYAKRHNSRRLLLGVHSRNTNAIAFYQKLGYKIVGERKFKVGHHEYNDLVLALEI